MSFASSGGARGAPALPPEKGVFPLDHFAECKEGMRKYVACLKEHGNNGADRECRALAKGYLQCRMDHQLMAEQDLDQLGYSAASDERAVRPLGVDSEVAKVKTGFVAGLPADMKKESS
mmetsp:Transcript_3434/g.13878  ORF Transcript_3434/g.13878 Transcript_3434/m.13878 type:complete len:119 (-) Transcript_3434:39-395(-)|eukprot:PRCOL_00001792-RA